MVTALKVFGLAAGVYVVLLVLAFVARNRITFPSPRDRTPEPAQFGMPDGRRVEVPVEHGARLVGWYLPPPAGSEAEAPALLWFHGNGETVGGIAPVLAEFRPAGAALLCLNYRGYGDSEGRATVSRVERDAVAAWRWLAARPEVDSSRIVVYGRSVGSGPAVAVAASQPVAGLILESAFTSLGEMARATFPIFPTSLLSLGFDNVERIGRVRSPVLLIHGDADALVPFRMRAPLEAAARAAGVEVETWTIRGGGHNESYYVGGEEYVRRVAAFVERVTQSSSPD